MEEKNFYLNKIIAMLKNASAAELRIIYAAVQAYLS